MEKTYIYNNIAYKRILKGNCLRNREAIIDVLKDIPDNDLKYYKCTVLLKNIKEQLSQREIKVSDSCIYRYLRMEKANRFNTPSSQSQYQSDDNESK